VPAVAVAVALPASGAVSQLVTPFVRRDDWPFLLPAGVPGIDDPLDKVREEGRWLSYGWWFVVGQHGTPATAVVVLFTAYVLFVLGLWRLFDEGGVISGALLAVALLLSPLWVRLAYWPGTLSASAVVAAVAVWTLPRAALHRGGLVAWVLVATTLAVLTYPPVAGVLLIAAAVHLGHRSWRQVLLLSGTFVAAFGLGVVVSFGLDLVAFGHFGVAIAPWRHPHGLTSLHDLRVNGGRYLHQVVTLGATLRWSAAVGATASFVALADARVRPALLKVGAAVVVVAALECAQTIDTGVRTNVRGSGWAWLAVVVPAGLLLAGRPPSRRVGQVALGLLALLGLVAWRSDIATHQATERAYTGIVTAAARAGHEVVLYQRPADRRTARGRITEGTLRAMFYEETGRVVRWCRPDECRELAALVGHGPVHDLGAVTGVIVPRPPRVL
jgi:MFS family permease